MSIGKELRLQVVAEGVETQAQVDYLQSLGVRYVQGWLFARAMSSQDCDDWLAVNLEGRTPEEAAASTFVGLL
ncbi:MAG: EAL domain-containing protein [Rhodoferax sp.]|nr:EAL domain-containing protein [Rhodoferax sp.]